MNQQKFYLLFAYSKLTIDIREHLKFLLIVDIQKKCFQVDNTNKKISFLHFNSNFLKHKILNQYFGLIEIFRYLKIIF